MDSSLTRLASDPKFIPLVYNYCDMWCGRCRLTGRCLLFAAEATSGRQRDSRGDVAASVLGGLETARALLETAVPGTEAIAAINVKLADPDAPPERCALGHPLEFLARHYAIQAGSYLHSLQGRIAEGWPEDSPLEVVSWLHILIAAKTYRSLVSAHGAAEAPELLFDALGSAKLVLVAIDRSLTAWQAIAAVDTDARVSGLIELLEALRTGVEIRFPEARAFVRPGLDEEDDPAPVPGDLRGAGF
jgi:hypothetical protein